MKKTIHLHLALDAVVELKDAVNKLEELLKKKGKKESEMFTMQRKKFYNEIHHHHSIPVQRDSYHISFQVDASGMVKEHM